MIGAPSTIRVLVVDDDELDRLAVRRALVGASLDVEVTEVADVDAAWRVLGDASIDLIVLDHNLGAGTGLDLLRLLASRGLSIPVIAMTGQQDRRTAVEVMKAGAQEYIDKSALTPELMRAVVPSVLRAARARADEITALERLRLAAATADIGTWDYYPETGELELSDRARAQLGVLPTVTVDYPLFLSLVHTEDRSAVDGAFRADVGANRGQDFQVDFRVSHGPPVGTRWLSAKGREVARAASGVAATPHVVGALVDVTERKTAERAAGERAEIVESLQRFGEALTSSIAREDLIELATHEARRMLGADQGAFVARVPGEGPDARAVAASGAGVDAVNALPADIRQLPFASGAGNRSTHGDITYFGVPVVSATSGVIGGLLFGTSGDPGDDRAVRLARGIAGWAAVAMDNARLFQAEKEARDEAEAAVRARDDTLAVVTHDLRNPLNSVLVSSGLILRGDVPPDEVAREMDVIKRAGHHMQRLINDLLDTAQIESGSLSVEAESLDPVPLLDEVAELFAHRVGTKGITLVVDRDSPAGLRVRADRVRVVQALGNLVANGVKFTEAGGEVRLSIQPDEHAVRFIVADSGTGVPDTELPHIFKRFWQGRPGDRAGAGLGLGIVKGIAEAHGGDVGVETAMGEGSTFWFSVPRVAADAATGEAASSVGDDAEAQAAAAG